MAIISRNILIRECEQDAGQARHLQETLKRMYTQDNDHNFEMATGRAEGIAAHYSRKEEILNTRISEEDQTNIPTELNEWAEMLSRRKVMKHNTWSHSRSKSLDKKKKQKQENSNIATTSKPQKGAKHAKPQPPKKPTNNKPNPNNRHLTNSGSRTKTKPPTKDHEYRQAPRLYSQGQVPAIHKETTMPKPWKLYPRLPKVEAQNCQTNLTEEELWLITMLRAKVAQRGLKNSLWKHDIIMYITNIIICLSETQT